MAKTKNFKDLNLSNAFLFAVAMQDEETCRIVLETVLDKEIGNLNEQLQDKEDQIDANKDVKDDQEKKKFLVGEKSPLGTSLWHLEHFLKYKSSIINMFFLLSSIFFYIFK